MSHLNPAQALALASALRDAADKITATVAPPTVPGFPDYPLSDLPPLPEGWTDATFKNDGTPRYQFGLCDVSIDYADPMKRFDVVELDASEPNPRFTVMRLVGHLGEDGGTSGGVTAEALCDPANSPPLLTSDDWAEVLAFVTKREETRRAYCLRMADLTDRMARAVSEMVIAFEEAEDGASEANGGVQCPYGPNDWQPEGFSEIIAGSLDEWAPSIPEVARAWRALAEV